LKTKPELRAMLRKALERKAIRVEEAPDGNSAIDKIRSRRYLLDSFRFETAREFRSGRAARIQAASIPRFP
jgi:CheY-like chemotaxis protein